MSVFLTEQPSHTRVSSGLPRTGFRGAQSRSAVKFGNTASQAVKPIRYLNLADKIGGVFNTSFLKKLITREPNLWNMSMQDWMVRMMLVFCLYVPQAYTSIKKDQHKWETNGRNIVTWLMGLSIGIFLKHDRYSINALLDGLMRPKGTPYEQIHNSLKRSQEHREFLREHDLAKKPPVGADWPWWKRVANSLGLGASNAKFSQDEKRQLNAYRKAQKMERYLERKIPKLEQRQNRLVQKLGGIDKAKRDPGGLFQKLLNRIRLQEDYYDLISKPEVGIQIKRGDRYRAFWASMTDLQMSLVHQRIQALKDIAKSGGIKPEEAKELKVLQQFTNQITLSRPIRNLMDTTLGIIMTGFVLMWIVFKAIAPLDHDFDPDRMPGKLKKGIREDKRKDGAPPGALNVETSKNAFANTSVNASPLASSASNPAALSRPQLSPQIHFGTSQSKQESRFKRPSMSRTTSPGGFIA